MPSVPLTVLITEMHANPAKSAGVGRVWLTPTDTLVLTAEIGANPTSTAMLGHVCLTAPKRRVTPPKIVRRTLTAARITHAGVQPASQTGVDSLK